MSRIMQMPPPPPLLLTKRVTSFLRANLSSHIHSAMLTTPAGSLLAHASSLPASALRRQAAVAASLWALQGPAPTSHDPATASIPPGSTVRTRRSGKHAPPTVTVQLDSGAVFVIRRLRCGMLFICMGGAEAAAAAAAASGRLTPTPPAPHMTRLSRSPAPTAPTTEAQSRDQPPDTTTTTTNPSTTPRPSTPPPPSAPPQPLIPTPPNPATMGNTNATTAPPTGNPPSSTTTPNSPSQASILSTHTTGAASTTSTATFSGGSSVSLMRRQVEELARWLDERLGGLCVPEEGIGIFGASGGMGAAGNGVAGGGLEVR
ncbi:hypothetical protein C8A01DRAFT_31631 [Parachaetomium inaequale]|uniref:Uncharacterized protein n=1 Tax=Parachaetomium inaequale TaxID=2588326 RepID=A0AAN6SV70_9PEZI|nr:hypothetical protein C8A01DRAFT_31631 [Parachaetomium inaequale]